MTNDELQAHVKSGGNFPNSDWRRPAKAIRCADGFEVSVQASKTHYCAPRDDRGPYDTFELGFPTAEDDLIAEYADEPSKPTDTVYGNVPVDVVLALINKHGGEK